MNQRKNILFSLVEDLYQSSSRPIASWMWKNHVQWIANKTLELSKKYHADADIVYAGALLHDIADVWLERKDEAFDQKCDQTARQVLLETGYSDEEIDFVISNVIAPHSCYDDQPQPNTVEGKILATADGLAHLMTDFYEQFEKMGHPTTDKKAFDEWGRNKIERDFYKKLFFEDEKNQAKENYNKLKIYFAVKQV